METVVTAYILVLAGFILLGLGFRNPLETFFFLLVLIGLGAISGGGYLLYWIEDISTITRLTGLSPEIFLGVLGLIALFLFSEAMYLQTWRSILTGVTFFAIYGCILFIGKFTIY